MINTLLKIIFLYIPALYGYWVFIFLVFIDEPISQVEIHKSDDEIRIVEVIQ